MSCHHLICLKETEQEQPDDTSADTDKKDPFLELVRTGSAYIDLQMGPSLIEAAKVGHERCVKKLIESGADVNCTDVNGNTSSNESAAFNRVECLMLLLSAGADVNIRNKVGETPLLRATFERCTRENLHEEKCVKLLMDAGADVNIADDSGYSPIIISASRGHYKQVELLIQAGADVNARTQKRADVYRSIWLPPGTTALLAAARFRYALNTFKVLLRFGAHVNIRTDPEYSSLETSAEVRLNTLETTFSGDYQNGGFSSEEVVSLLHAAGETTDGTAFYEFSIGHTAFRRKIEFPEYLLKRQSSHTLKDVCREAIRKHLLDINPHLNLFMRIPQLGLPSRLAQYLLFDEHLKINEENLN